MKIIGNIKTICRQVIIMGEKQIISFGYGHIEPHAAFQFKNLSRYFQVYLVYLIDIFGCNIVTLKMLYRTS